MQIIQLGINEKYKNHFFIKNAKTGYTVIEYTVIDSLIPPKYIFDYLDLDSWSSSGWGTQYDWMKGEGTLKEFKRKIKYKTESYSNSRFKREQKIEKYLKEKLNPFLAKYDDANFLVKM